MLFFRGAHSTVSSTGRSGSCPNLSLGPLFNGSWMQSVRISGGGGLGVLARDGLVRPVSLVKSAVDARLTLLVMERLRSAEKLICRLSGAASSSWFSSALVKRDEFPSPGLRTVVFWNMGDPGPGCPDLYSGGSSTSAPISSSATGGIFGVRDTHADTPAACEVCLPSSILSARKKDRRKSRL